MFASIQNEHRRDDTLTQNQQEIKDSVGSVVLESPSGDNAACRGVIDEKKVPASLFGSADLGGAPVLPSTTAEACRIDQIGHNARASMIQMVLPYLL